MPIDLFEEFFDDEDDNNEVDSDFHEIIPPEDKVTLAHYRQHMKNRASNERKRRAKDGRNEVGICPPIPESIKEKREFYKTHFVQMHRDVFPDSTGVKPFGKKQELSIEFGQDVFNKGSGRLLKLEPRGYAKTTRITNEALCAVLLGMQDYIVIVCSNLEKAADILESLKTEIYNNEQLATLFPGPMACFRNLGDTAQRAKHQTYGGHKTHIEWGSQLIQFPWVPGEPSSGKVIEVRPMTNLKGLHLKVEAGPDVGKVYRPTLFLFDDPQTHDDATSETTVKKIISRIKRDALRGGSHARRAAAIMSITPVAPGDVAWHFAKEEHSWDLVEYKMMEKFPDNHEWWMNEYAKVYLGYDRTVRGDRTRAALDAKKLLEDNWDYAHEGSEVTWEHAYGWDEDPQTEVSPVQHAYNIILDDGMEDFEYECQCNIEYGTYQEGESLHAPISRIKNKTLPYRRMQLPQDTSHLVCHIDVNKELLTYVVCASPTTMRPHFVDYGTWPQQPGQFSKRNLTVPMSAIYPELIDYRERIYKGVKDLITALLDRVYLREDGVKVNFTKVGVDLRYEEVYVTRAITESIHRASIRPCWGETPKVDEPLLHEKERANAIAVFENCYIEPNKRRTLDVLHYDTNFFKTELHKGFNLEEGVRGSATLFGKEFDGTPIHEDRHLPYANHLNIERPKREEGKKHTTRIVWEEKMHQPDNEFFDNSVNCLALLVSEGVQLSVSLPPSQKKKEKTQDMQEFMNQQRRRKLL